MEAVEQIKSRFENYFKKTREVKKTREIIVENLLTTRRITRANALTERRNINDMLSPSPSPVLMVSPAKQTKTSPKKMNRLERMKLWKAEKLKKMEEEKAKNKPIFKLGAKANIGFPNVNDSKQIVKSFAPKNYKFKPPSNVQGIELFAVKKTDVFKRVTRSQKPTSSPPLSLPARTRKKQVAGEKEKKKYVKEKKVRNKLGRQDAFDEVFEETNNKVSEKKPKQSQTKTKVQKENKENEPLNYQLEINTPTETKNKRRSSRRNRDEEPLKTSEEKPSKLTRKISVSWQS